MQWDDITINYKFRDGSHVVERHDTVVEPTYKFTIQAGTFIVSEDHYLLCDVSRCKKAIKRLLTKAPNIPSAMDVHITDDVNEEVIYGESAHFYKNLWWLSAKDIYYLYSINEIVMLVNNLKEYKGGYKHNKVNILDTDYSGEKECFCVATNTGRYEVCGVVHHNSTAIRNIIFHALTHGEDIKIGLIDLKVSEFGRYKGYKNVVGVATTTREAVELLRLARECMYKRNRLNAERNVDKLSDYVPQKPTNKISIFNQSYDEDFEFLVEVGGQRKTMTAKEILEHVNEQPS